MELINCAILELGLIERLEMLDRCRSSRPVRRLEGDTCSLQVAIRSLLSPRAILRDFTAYSKQRSNFMLG